MARAAAALRRVALDVRETSHMSMGMTLYVRKLREWLPRVAPDLELVEVGHGDNFDWAEQVGLPIELARAHAALAHIPSPFVPRVVPLRYLMTIHDVIDLEFPQFGKRKVGPYWRTVVAPVARGAQAVLTSDERTREALVRFLGLAWDRVRLVPLGSDDPPEPAQPMRRARPYLLYVGNRRPHKDLATLFAVWEDLPERYAVDLVLTGPADDLPTRRRGPGELCALGDCPAELLRSWYAGAAAYVHPAWREGFGLPLLEAMRNGAPVVAAHEAVPGVLAPHVRSAPARDVAAFRAHVMALLDDPAAARAAAGAARLATLELTWENTARLTAGVYRELL